jgi:DNA-binding CsgD family transcriptional regulator
MPAALRRARAWHAACTGHVAAAVRDLLEIATELEADGNVADALLSLQDVVRLGEHGLVVERARAIAAGFQGPMAMLVVDHAERLAAGDGHGLDAVADRAGRLGLHLVAAHAHAQAADAHAAAGLRAAAAASRRLAAEWQQRADGAITPALLGNRTPSLTRREREVAELAATGLSDQQIADELVVSVRTVETHIGNAYAKLGVRNRRQLTELLGRRDPAASPASPRRS